MVEQLVARVTGSASVAVTAQVSGPRRPVPVVHAGADAVYLDLGGTCVGVLSAHAALLPCGVRTTLGVLPEVPAGGVATVGQGTVLLAGLEVVVEATVDTTVPVLDPSVGQQGAGRLALLADAPTRRVRDLLPRDALEALLRSDPAAVPLLLGLGPGLTPLGDDVLGGWLTTAVATRHPGLDEVHRAVALAAPERTTTLSSTLLTCAARGEAVPELRPLLVGLGAGNAAAVEVALDALVRVGDTSGAGALLGAVTALASSALQSSAPHASALVQAVR